MSLICMLMMNLMPATVKLMSLNEPLMVMLHSQEVNLHKSILQYLSSKRGDFSNLPKEYLERYNTVRWIRSMFAPEAMLNDKTAAYYNYCDGILSLNQLSELTRKGNSRDIAGHIIFYGGSYDARIQKANPNDSVLTCIGKFLVIIRKIKNSEYESMDAFEADEDVFHTSYLPVAGDFVTLDYFSDLLAAYSVFGKLHFEESDMASMIPDYSDEFLYLYVSPYGKNAIDCMLKVKSIERKHGKKVVLILGSDQLGYKSMFSSAKVFHKVISSNDIDKDIIALASFSSASIISHKNGRVSIRQLILSDY